MFLSWLGLMQIGCISVHPFLFNEKFFFQKPLILLGLFNITKKKLKKSSKKLFTFKKVVYICKVNKAQNLKTRKMKKELNQQEQIFWKGNICELIKWETLTLQNELVVKINGQFYSVKLNQLKNK